MSESDLYPAIIGEYSRGGTRLFRQASGLAWQGTVLERSQSRLVLGNPRAIRAGVPGMADLGGFTGVLITPDLLGDTIAQYVAIECKSAIGRLTEEQTAFLQVVKNCGGRAGIVRSVEEAGEIIRRQY